MEKRNLKRHEPDRKSTKLADQGDNITETDKYDQVRQTFKRTLLQADRGDSKLKQPDKGQRKNEIKSKSYKDLIFQSKHGRLELKPSKPNKPNNLKPVDEKAKKTGDNLIVMDTQIKPFLNSKEIFNADSLKDSKIYVGIEKKVDADERRRIREKYTKRNINNNSNSLNATTSSLLQNDSSKKICNDNPQVNKMAESKSESTKIVKESAGNKSTNANRKPVITTVRSKKDNTKVYKTVTFTDFKAQQRHPIQIKIPTDVEVKIRDKDKENAPAVKKEFCDKATDASQHSSKESKKSVNRKKRTQKSRAHVPSPEPLKGESPPTEVAKWAPNSVNRQNKPYYEAWVSTTLAAITKYSKNDRMFQEKQNLLQSFRRMLERPDSPDLVFNHADEKYMGRIRVRQT